MFPLNPALPDNVEKVDVPASKTNEALTDSVVPKSIGVDEVETVLEPNFNVRLFNPDDVIVVAVSAYPVVSKEPFTMDKAFIVNAVPSVHSAPTPFTVKAEAKETPFVVNVFPVVDPDSVIAPV